MSPVKRTNRYHCRAMWRSRRWTPALLSLLRCAPGTPRSGHTRYPYGSTVGTLGSESRRIILAGSEPESRTRTGAVEDPEPMSDIPTPPYLLFTDRAPPKCGGSTPAPLVSPSRSSGPGPSRVGVRRHQTRLNRAHTTPRDPRMEEPHRLVHREPRSLRLEVVGEDEDFFGCPTERGSGLPSDPEPTIRVPTLRGKGFTRTWGSGGS